MLPVAQAIAIPTTTADVDIIGGAVVLVGWAFAETTAAAVARVELYGVGGASGGLIAPISLASGDSKSAHFPEPGVEVLGMLTLHVLVGSVKGVVYVIPAERMGAFELASGEKVIWAGQK